MSLTISTDTLPRYVPEKSVAQRLGVRVSTVKALGLAFPCLAAVDVWLASAPAEALIELRRIETTSRVAA
jgi:hypothetical protein